MCNVKLEEQKDAHSIVQESPKILNPFVHKLHVGATAYEKFKLLFMSIFVLPFRVIGICLCLAIAYIISRLGLWGMTRQDLAAKPMTGYRAVAKKLIETMLRLTLTFGGFGYVNVKGQGHKANSKDAPVMVVAPHSSFYDILPCLQLGAPSVVAKGESQDMPVFSKFIDYTQPIYVYREDPNSRLKTIKEIKRRAYSEHDWSQIMIFPEGTCTNRSCLVTFKPGAFFPGVPVQPVVIRYPNKTDCISWTWDGSNGLKSLWVTLCQFLNYCEIEYLPVYKPSPEEIEDPYVFARNVRQVMADALGVPVVDYSFEDCHLMMKAKKKNLPGHCGLIEFQVFKNKFGMDSKSVEFHLNRFADLATKEGTVSLKEFSHYLQVPVTEPSLVELFNLYDKDGFGRLTFRDFLLGFCEHTKPILNENTIRLAFKLFDCDNKDFITLEDVTRSLKQILNFDSDESDKLFSSIVKDSKDQINYDTFYDLAMKLPEFAKLFTIYQKSEKEGTREKSLARLADKTKAE